MTEPCKYDGTIETLRDITREIKTDTRDILHVLNGNGGPGLLTKAALNKQSIGRLWWFVSVILAGMVGMFFWLLRGALKA
jgi:hypothetical protein